MTVRSHLRVMHFAGASVRGGLLKHLETLVGGLAASGLEVEVVLSPSSEVNETARICSEAGARVARFTVRGKTDLSGMMRLRGHVSMRRPDLFHAHLSSPVEALPALMAARWGGANHIVTTEHAPTWAPLRHVYSKTAKKAASRWLDAVVVLSESDRRHLLDEFAIPASLIHVIPNGVSPDIRIPDRQESRSRLGLPQDIRLVGYVGELEEKKGLLDLVDAIESLRDPGIGLVLAGRGELAGELEERAENAAFSIILVGQLEEVSLLFAAVDLFAFPSHQEALPLAVLEAMSAGMPIVATRVGGIPEALDYGQAGVLVEPRRSGMLAGAIRGLLVDRNQAGQLAARAKHRAGDLYSAEKMTRSIEALYASIAADALMEMA